LRRHELLGGIDGAAPDEGASHARCETTASECVEREGRSERNEQRGAKRLAETALEHERGQRERDRGSDGECTDAECERCDRREKRREFES
jgi:hypothetical protein